METLSRVPTSVSFFCDLFRSQKERTVKLEGILSKIKTRKPLTSEDNSASKLEEEDNSPTTDGEQITNGEA